MVRLADVDRAAHAPDRALDIDVNPLVVVELAADIAARIESERPVLKDVRQTARVLVLVGLLVLRIELEVIDVLFPFSAPDDSVSAKIADVEIVLLRRLDGLNLIERSDNEFFALEPVGLLLVLEELSEIVPIAGRVSVPFMRAPPAARRSG